MPKHLEWRNRLRKIILFIGAPGSGKGSRSEECKKAGYIHISSSKLIEDAGYDLSRGGSRNTRRSGNQTHHEQSKKFKQKL